jgi:hypothetical protein
MEQQISDLQQQLDVILKQFDSIQKEITAIKGAGERPLVEGEVCFFSDKPINKESTISYMFSNMRGDRYLDKEGTLWNIAKRDPNYMMWHDHEGGEMPEFVEDADFLVCEGQGTIDVVRGENVNWDCVTRFAIVRRAGEC